MFYIYYCNAHHTHTRAQFAHFNFTFASLTREPRRQKREWVEAIWLFRETKCNRVATVAARDERMVDASHIHICL